MLHVTVEKSFVTKPVSINFAELAIQPTLNASLMPRNPNDVVPNQAGQSSSQLGAVATNNTEQPPPQSDITIQSGDNGSSASQQPGAQVAATASSMG